MSSARIAPAPGRLHPVQGSRSSSSSSSTMTMGAPGGPSRALNIPRLDFRSRAGTEIFGNIQSTKRMLGNSHDHLNKTHRSVMSSVSSSGDVGKPLSSNLPLLTTRTMAGNVGTVRSEIDSAPARPTVNKMISISTALSMKTRVRQMRQRKTEIARAVPRIKIVHDDKAQRHRYIIPWDSRFRRGWDVIAVCFVMYLSFKVPISVAFDGAWTFPKWFDKVMDVYFVTDIILNFRTGYVHSGHHITDPALIREHYMQRWFWVDLIATIPFESIFASFLGSSARKSLKMLKWLKFPKLLRLSRFLRYLKSNIKYYQTFVLCISGVFCIHVLGCMFVATVSQCTDFEETADGNFETVIYCTSEQMTAYYASGVYAALLMLLNVLDGTQFTKLVEIGTGRTVSEVNLDGKTLGTRQSARRLSADEAAGPFAVLSRPGWMLFDDDEAARQVSRDYIIVYIVCGITAVIGFALLIQLIAEAVMFSHQRSQAFRAFYQRVAHAKLEMESHHLPEDLQYRVTRYYDYLWMNNRQGQGSRTSGILQDDDLSQPLKKKVALAMHGSLLRQVTIFDGCSENCIFDIAMRLRLHVYMPQDYIFSTGEVATELYLVREGSVKLVIPTVHARRSMVHEAQAMARIQEVEGASNDTDTPRSDPLNEADLSAVEETTNVLKESSPQKPQMDRSREAGGAHSPRGGDDDVDDDASDLGAASLGRGVEVQGDNLVKLMGQGTYFGELALLTELPRACDAISFTMTELNELSKRDFHEVMTKFPELNEEIVEEVSAEYPHLREQITKYSEAATAHIRMGGMFQDIIEEESGTPNTASSERRKRHADVGLTSAELDAKLDAKLDAMEERIMARIEKLLTARAPDTNAGRE